MKTIKIIKHILEFSEEEKKILNRAEEILKQIDSIDVDKNIWLQAYDKRGDCCDFYDISVYLNILAEGHWAIEEEEVSKL